MDTAQFVNFYEILQIGQTAADDEIRAAITKQRRLWVKRQTSADPARRTEAETRVRDLDRAEKVLLDNTSRAAFDRALATYRPPAPSAGGGVDWLDRARAYLEQDNPSAANYAAREAINQRGDDDSAWFLRAHSSFLLGNARDAEYEFGEAIRLAPGSAPYRYGLGEVFAAQEKWRQALNEYAEALRLAPGDPEYRTSMAQVMLRNDQASAALAIMEEVVREHPENEAFRFYLAVALHDEALESLGKTATLVAAGRVLEGGFMILSEAQAALMSARADRVEGLRVTEPDIVAMVAEMREMVGEARHETWDFRGTKSWVAAFLVLGIFPLLGGSGAGSAGPVFFGLFAGAVIVYLYVNAKRRPYWRHRLAAVRNLGTLQKEGI